jgi:hypothetical protein
LVLAFKVVGLVKWIEAAAMAPNVTVDVAVKFVPVMTTVVPPPVGPADGASEVIVGAASKVKLVLVPEPPGVMTFTWTAPAPWALGLAFKVVALVKWTEAADVAPNVTVDVAVKLVPVITTVVPPPVDPAEGSIELIVGAASKVKLVLVTDPPGVVTFTRTAPAPWALVLAFKVVALVKCTVVAAVAPNVTVDVEVKPVPVMATVVPPAIGPADGASEVTVGAASKVKLVLVTDPPGVVTFTWTGPAPWALVLAFKVVALVKCTVVAAVAPNVTVDVAVKFVPVMTTVVPPLVVPDVGLTEVTVGAAT